MAHKILYITLSLFLLASLPAQGQNSKLAEQYYLDGEYEKAADIFESLYKKSNRSDFFFNRYVECMMALEEYDKSVQVIKQQQKLQPTNASLYVTLGNVYERQNKFEDADEQFTSAIDNLPPQVGAITKLGNSFIQVAKYDLAIRTYEHGGKLLKNPGLFSYNLADLYRRKGDNEKMIEQYLTSLHHNPQRLSSIKSIFQRFLGREDYPILQEKLYEFIQEYPDTDHFPEMLAWFFIQRKDYKSALRQVKALDKRLDENGARVVNLAHVAANARDYDTAIEAYDYIVESKGPTSSYYLEAKRSSLSSKRKKILYMNDYSIEDLMELEKEYETFLNEFGWNKNTAQIISELSKLEALHLNNLDKAIELLNQVIEFPNVQKYIQANAKISLADYYLMKGEIWESTLLYSQVDKAFQEEQIGQEARFRNAKLSYYNGDFEWAQTQFDVLKTSTSKMIANDALDLSVFIMDNLGLDTTNHPMTVYAEADLLVFQNQFDQAISKLMVLSNLYPDHGLQDDIKYLRAQIHKKKREFDKARVIFEDIMENHAEEIRADNAMFELAEIYENQLKDKDKAMALYERIFIEHADSTFSIEARKRFRTLRGDFAEEPLN